MNKDPVEFFKLSVFFSSSAEHWGHHHHYPCRQSSLTFVLLLNHHLHRRVSADWVIDPTQRSPQWTLGSEIRFYSFVFAEDGDARFPPSFHVFELREEGRLEPVQTQEQEHLVHSHSLTSKHSLLTGGIFTNKSRVRIKSGQDVLLQEHGPCEDINEACSCSNPHKGKKKTNSPLLNFETLFHIDVWLETLFSL